MIGAGLTRLAQWFKPQTAVKVRLGYEMLREKFPETLADLMVQCMMREVLYVPGDQSTTIFNTGKQAIGQHICEVLAITPDEFEELRRYEDVGRVSSNGYDRPTRNRPDPLGDDPGY